MRTLFLFGRGRIFTLHLFCIFVVSSTSMFAQDYLEICATPDNNDPDPIGVYSYSIDPVALAALPPDVVNIYFWRIDGPPGSPGHPNELTEQRALEGIQHLNINFNPAGIFFKYGGMGSFNSPPDVVWRQKDPDCNACRPFPFNTVEPCIPAPLTVDPDGYQLLSQCQRYEMWDYAEDLDNEAGYKANAINVYVPAGTTDFGGAGEGTRIVIHPGLVSDTFLHEMGHVLGLTHTHTDFNSNCEQVTRDPNDLCVPMHPEIPCFNATNHGDDVVDTAAMPDFRNEHCIVNTLTGGLCNVNASNGGYQFLYYDQINCVYIGTTFPFERTDCKGTPYDIAPSDARNYMGYNATDCSDNFTVGQGIRMKESLATSAILIPTKTTIASLYEPYKGEYYVSGPLPTHYVPPHFQPGFEYRFVECQTPLSTPEPYSTSNTFPYNLSNVLLSVSAGEENFGISHPNHSAIGILVAPSNSDPGFWPRPKKCYDNWNRAAKDGKIIKFNDDILNTNITLTPKDSIGINSQDLINDLPNGLYKIEKNYDDGAIKETLIYKGNN